MRLTLEEKIELKEELRDFVKHVCTKPEGMPPEALSVLPAVVNILFENYR